MLLTRHGYVTVRKNVMYLYELVESTFHVESILKEKQLKGFVNFNLQLSVYQFTLSPQRQVYAKVQVYQGAPHRIYRDGEHEVMHGWFGDGCVTGEPGG